MIKSKKDYKDYVIKDELANGGKHRSFYFCDELKKWQIVKFKLNI